MTRIDEMRDQLRDFMDDVERSKVSIRQLNVLFTRYLSLARRFGLPEDMMETIIRIKQAEVAVLALYRGVMLLQVATGPVGWLTAIGGMALGTMMLADQMAIERPRY